MRDGFGVGLEFRGVFGEVGGPAGEDFVHGFVAEAGGGGGAGADGGCTEAGWWRCGC